MDKVVTPRTGRAAPEHSVPLSIIGAIGRSVLVILLTGYLNMQLQLSEIHVFLDFNERPIGVEGDWLRYVWSVLLIVLVVAAVLVYRVAIRGTVARLTALATLAVLVLMAIPMSSGPRINAPEGYPLVLHIVVEGAKSPLVFALIGAIIADILLGRRKVRAN